MLVLGLFKFNCSVPKTFMVIGGQRVQTNEKFWTNVLDLSGTVHLYVLLTSLYQSEKLRFGVLFQAEIMLETLILYTK